MPPSARWLACCYFASNRAAGPVQMDPPSCRVRFGNRADALHREQRWYRHDGTTRDRPVLLPILSSLDDELAVGAVSCASSLMAPSSVRSSPHWA
jgi:hypothetical protein